MNNPNDSNRYTGLVPTWTGNPVISIISNKTEYDATLKRVEEIMEFGPILSSSLEAELEHLSILVERYENKNGKSSSLL